jgi:hypothetical protein
MKKRSKCVSSSCTVKEEPRTRLDQIHGAVADFIIVIFFSEVNKRIVFPVPPYEIVIIGILIV